MHPIDARTFTPTQVFPVATPRARHDTRLFGDCPGPLTVRRSVPPGTRGVPTGEVWEWHLSTGWTIVPGSESEGPNGIETSPDGRTLYVDLWPARKLMRLSRGTRPSSREVVDVPFHPDNIRWQPDGSLLIAGHGGPTIQRVAQCVLAVCDDVTSNVARVDPRSLAIQTLITLPAHETFFSSTTALQVGREIWIGSVAGNRIARHPLP